jgi:di/tricarboxylate transporter
MSVELTSILVLCAVFLLATVFPIHMGALALAAAFVVGMCVLGGDFDAKVEQIAGGFPGDLFVVLAGVTYLFAIAKNNGTVDWLVHAAMRSVRGRVALIPWVMFLVTGALAAVGAAGPAAVAMIAPVGIGFAVRHRINPVLVGLMIVNGASAGSFSPIGIFGSITNNVVERNGIEPSPLTLFTVCFAFNVLLGLISVVLFGGRERSEHGTWIEQAPLTQNASGTAARHTASIPALDANRTITVVGLLALTIGALFFDLDVGFSAFVLAVLLSAIDPSGAKGAINQIAWSTVLLVCGIVTYVSLMESLGTIDYLGNSVAMIGTALIGALAICYIGGGVSAFASTTGILGASFRLRYRSWSVRT